MTDKELALLTLGMLIGTLFTVTVRTVMGL